VGCSLSNIIIEITASGKASLIASVSIIPPVHYCAQYSAGSGRRIPVVGASLGQQSLVPPARDDLAVDQDQDLIGASDGAQAMDNDEAGGRLVQ